MNARLKIVESAAPDEAPEAQPEISLTETIAAWSLAQVVEQAQSLQGQGLLQPAAAVYQTWLASHPQERMRHAALFNHAALLQGLGRMEHAIEVYRECLVCAPSFGQAYVNLGLLYEKMGQTDAALQVWSQYIGQRLLRDAFDLELQCTTLNHIGRLQEARKHYDLAERALRDSLQLNPRQAGVIQHWVHIRQKACQWPVFQALPGLNEGDLLRSTSPLAMLALSDDPEQQLITAQRFVHRTYPFAEEFLHDKQRRPGARWRVGLVSADLREHAVGFLLPAFLHGLDAQRYELVAYDYTATEQTPLRRRLEGMFDHIRNISTLTDRQAAELIVQDRIDILIDLHGLSSGARPGIFALHPAPHQATYLGYIGSTGMPWFDHVIVDPQVMPPALVSQFTEKPLYLSSSFIPLTHEEPAPVNVSREEEGLPTQGFVMAAFGNVYKITPEMFACWMRTLSRIEDSVLWLIDDNPVTTRHLRAAAEAHGVDAGRLVFSQRCDHRKFCAQLQLADVYLDTYPYNCGSTSNDVVNASVPLVSLYGQTLVSRMGLSILTELGQSDLAVTSFDAYEDKVLEVFLRTRAGYRYAYHHRVGLSPLMEALDKIREGESTDAVVVRELAPVSRVERLVWPTPVVATAAGHSAQVWCQEWDAHPAIRHQLLQHLLDADTLYALDSPAWAALTGLEPGEWRRRLGSPTMGTDAVVMATGWDVHSVYANPWAVMSIGRPEWLKTAQDVVNRLGFSLDLREQLATAQTSLCSLTVAARKPVWMAWLRLTQKLHAWVNEENSPLGNALRQSWTVDGVVVTAAQMIQPLLMNLVLADDRWQVSTLDPYALPARTDQAQPIYPFAVQCNALKQASIDTGLPRFRQEFERLSASMKRQLGTANS
jgi:predicted O-linked N-acetylglucosamine transferase (SPINDLY family)